MKKSLAIVPVMLLLLLGTPSSASAAEGDLVWSKDIRFGGVNFAYGIAINGDSMFIAGDYATCVGCNDKWRVEKRSLSSGDFIWGVNSSPGSSLSNYATGVAADDSSIYVVGPADRLYIEKRSQDTGGLVWSKSTGSGTAYEYHRVVADKSGAYAVGYSPSGAYVAKHSSVSGDIIWSKTLANGSYDRFGVVAIDDNNVYVAGYETNTGSFNFRMLIQGYSLATGNLVWSKIEDPGAGQDTFSGITADGTYVYVVGSDSSLGGTNYQWRIEKRSSATGDIIWSKIINFGAGVDAPMDVAVDINGLYVIGYDSSLGGTNYQWRIEKRSFATGDIIWSKTSNPTGTPDYAQSIALDKSAIYIAGSGPEWRIEKRELTPPNLPPTQPIVIPSVANTDLVNQLESFTVTATDGDAVPDTIRYAVDWCGDTGTCSNLTPPATAQWIPAITPPATPNYVASGTSQSFTHTWAIPGTKRFRIWAQDSEGAVSATYAEYVITISPPNCGITPPDADGNTYDTVQIDTQCWMRENMNVGIQINTPAVPSNSTKIEKYCYNNQAANCTSPHPTYADGGLYTWDEAMQYSTSEGAQGICPTGWHIPTDAEWYTLENYLKDTPLTSCDAGRSALNFYDCSTAGTKLKSGGSSGFEGNLSGFGSSGGFGFRDISSFLTSSSQVDATYAWFRTHHSTSAGVYRDDIGYKPAAYSVRCVKGVVAPSILQLCRENAPIAQGGGTYSFSLPTGNTTSFTVYYDATPDCAGTDVTASTTFAEANSTGGALTLSANGTNPRVFTGSSVGSELVTVSYSGASITMNATVSCTETVNCSSEQTSVCSGSTVPSGTTKAGTCGTVDCSNLPGTRYCDMNWKEVTPGF